MAERHRSSYNIFGRKRTTAAAKAAALAPVEEQEAARRRNGDGAAHQPRPGGPASPARVESVTGEQPGFLRPKAVLIVAALVLAYALFVAWLIAMEPPKQPRRVRFVTPDSG